MHFDEDGRLRAINPGSKKMFLCQVLLLKMKNKFWFSENGFFGVAPGMVIKELFLNNFLNNLTIFSLKEQIMQPMPTQC